MRGVTIPARLGLIPTLKYLYCTNSEWKICKPLEELRAEGLLVLNQKKKTQLQTGG